MRDGCPPPVQAERWSAGFCERQKRSLPATLALVITLRLIRCSHVVLPQATAMPGFAGCVQSDNVVK